MKKKLATILLAAVFCASCAATAGTMLLKDDVIDAFAASPNTSTATYAGVPSRSINTSSIGSGDIVASANGSSSGAGTLSSPKSLSAAISSVTAGKTIFLMAGTYSLPNQTTALAANGTSSNYIEMCNYNGGTVIFDGSNQSNKGTNSGARGLSVDGNYWHIYGITVRNCSDNGVYVTGDYNIIENCIFEANGDTGLQIGRFKSSLSNFDDWPHDNLILKCTSFNNSDVDGENADGFAAKLTCGNNNTFDHCIAYCNSDDGWDLYEKSDTGNIGRVIIVNSIAFGNGKTTSGSGSASGDMNGYKLGASGGKANHYIENCYAFANGAHGFTCNGNTGAMTIKNCTSFGNGRYNSSKCNYHFDKGATASVANSRTMSNLLSIYTGSTANDKAWSTMSKCLFWTNNAYYDLSSGVHDLDDKDGTKTSLTQSSVLGMFESTTLPSFSSNVHTTLRSSDGKINLGNFLKVKSGTAIAAYGGANLNGSSSGGGGGTNTDQAAANAVIAMINNIGTVTVNSGSTLDAIANAYGALTSTQKALVTNYSTYTAAVATYQDLISGGQGGGDTPVSGTVAMDVSGLSTGATTDKTGSFILGSGVGITSFSSGGYSKAVDVKGGYASDNTRFIKFTVSGSYTVSVYAAANSSRTAILMNSSETVLASKAITSTGGATFTFDYTISSGTYMVASAGSGIKFATVTLTPSGSGGGVNADQTAADAVIALINGIGTVTLNSGNTLDSVATAYNALTSTQKALVTNYSTYTAAVATYNNLVAEAQAQSQAQTVINMINNIGTVTLNSGSTLDSIANAYGALSSKAKGYVTNYSTYTAAVATYNNLVAEAQAQSQAQTVINMINNIGTVTLNSGSTLDSIANAYGALSSKAKGYVTNYSTYTAAVATYNALVEAAQQPTGEGVSMDVSGLSTGATTDNTGYFTLGSGVGITDFTSGGYSKAVDVKGGYSASNNRFIRFTVSGSGTISFYGSANTLRTAILMDNDGNTLASVAVQAAGAYVFDYNVTSGTYMVASAGSGIKFATINLPGSTGGATQTTTIQFSANDLARGTYTSNLTSGEFTIGASSSKNVAVENYSGTVNGVDYARRIKINGGGNSTGRYVSFTANAKCTIYITASATSDSATRTIRVSSGGVGSTIEGSFTVTGTNAAVNSVTVDEGGTFYIYSASSGIYVYDVTVVIG